MILVESIKVPYPRESNPIAIAGILGDSSNIRYLTNTPGYECQSGIELPKMYSPPYSIPNISFGIIPTPAPKVTPSFLLIEIGKLTSPFWRIPAVGISVN